MQNQLVVVELLLDTLLRYSECTVCWASRLSVGGVGDKEWVGLVGHAGGCPAPRAVRVTSRFFTSWFR